MDKFFPVCPSEYVKQLFKLHSSEVREHVLGLMGVKDYGEAESATQEAYLRALMYVKSSGEELRFPRAWLNKVAWNCYIRSESDRRKRFGESLDQILSESGEDTGPIVISDSISSQPDLILEDREGVEAITGKIKSLPKGVIRDVMILVAQGDTIEEVSQKVDRLPSAVKRYITRGRDLLRNQTDEE